MTKRWNRLAGASVAALTLVGCSWLTVQGPRPAWDGWAKARDVAPERMLRPGPGPVVVERVAATSARITWRSPWKGESVVRYAPNPELGLAPSTAATRASSVALAGLAPATRYFFSVETRTPQGVARSSLLSFRTR